VIPPTPRATLDVPRPDGPPIRVRLHGRGQPIRLFVSHGNGFASDGYFAFWRRFLPEYEIAVFDMRNHGHNARGDPATHDYPHMVGDVDAVLRGVAEEFGPKPSAGLFHSMSAQSALLAALDCGWRLDALVAFDPPNVPPEGTARTAMLRYLERLTAWAEARREMFADPVELAAEYAATRSGRSWAEETRLLMAQAVLRDGAGGWRLCCPPALEASMYAQGAPLELWPRRADFPGPVMLIGADPARHHATPTALSNRALAEAGGFDYAAIAGTSHLLQLEAPEACAEAAQAFLASVGLR
jgi:pimeloyl-ACP methyl ester carboxylesterase